LCGGRFASGFNNKSVWLWDPALDDPLVATSEGFRSSVIALVALGVEHLACVSLFDNRIHLINQNDGALVRILEGHREQVRSLAVLPDGRLASGSQDCTICLWDTSTPWPIAIFKGHQSFVTSLAVLGNGRLASGSGDATIRLWDPTQPDGAPRVLFGADAAITALAWIPTPQLLVAGDASGRLHWLEMGHP
jgi:WD40 repeat protein